MRIISDLFVYPVKSLRGTRVRYWQLDDRGLLHDRAWMVVDHEGNFVTQREVPKMATLAATIRSGWLVVDGSDGQPLGLPPEAWNIGPRRRVRVWKDECEAIDQGDEAARWFTQALGQEVRLVYMPRNVYRSSRMVDLEDRVQTGFSDGYPLLIASQESLVDLNSRLGTPIPIERFRPNIVVSRCGRPYEEDDWHTIHMSGVTMRVMSRCARCVITTTDHRTGERNSKEPTATLAKYRREGKEVFFAVNVNHINRGLLMIGDRVEVTKWNTVS